MKVADMNDSNIDRYLKITDLDNFFEVAQDKYGRYFFNINEALYFSVDKPDLNDPNTTQLQIDKTGLAVYTCTCNEYWTLISYKLYGTTRLSWLLMKLNDVDASNVFDVKQPGDRIWYLPRENVESIVADLNEFDE